LKERIAAKMKRSSQNATRRLVALALFAALAYVCTFLLHIKVLFLTFDAKDSMMAIAGMFFGPGAAAILSFLVPTLELFTIGSETGLYGFVMNVASSLAFSVTAAYFLGGAALHFCGQVFCQKRKIKVTKL
jgi:riboflavin transporter FmnP